MVAAVVEKRRVQDAIVHEIKGVLTPNGDTNWNAFGDTIPLYPGVDRALLEEGDPKPFYLTLDILQLNAVSENGLLYDEALVTAIEQQLPGMGGIQGHIPESEWSTSFPVDAVDWVGHVRIETKTYAKCYIPPGNTREFVRRVLARGGKLRTSISGMGIPQIIDENMGIYRMLDFELDSLDLAPATKAALRKYQSGEIVVTTEMMTPKEEVKEGVMPENEKEPVAITMIDVPQAVREQIVAEAKVRADAARVTELEQQVSALESAKTELASKLAETEQKVAEMVQYSTVCGEICAFLPPGTQTSQISALVGQVYQQLSQMAEVLGVETTSVEVEVMQQHAQMQEMKQAAFARQVDDAIAALTDWKVSSETGKGKRDAFRSTVKRALLSELPAGAADVTETLNRLWAAEFKPLAEALVNELTGGPAFVGGSRLVPTAQQPAVSDDDRIAEARGRTGF